jgi:ketosteroid isomerase-like protein
VSDDLRAIAQAVTSAYGRHDATALGTLYATGATLVFPGATFNGREEIIGMWRGWFTAFPDVASQTHRIFTSAGSFALEWTERGTQSGEFVLAGLHARATGLRLDWTGISRYEVAAGLIDHVRYYIDPTPLMSILRAR